jgi:divalent metal cation (Fe/Co/Zn/Cd) transporter
MTAVELTVITSHAEPITRAPGPSISDRERDRLVRRAKALSWLSLAWMTIEGSVAITAALAAGSIALLGFGLDSVIEALASVIVIWRFTGPRRLSDQAEERAQRLVAVSFLLLAPYVAQDAIRTLIAGDHPSISWVGIGLSISSLILMPLLGRAKQSIGGQLGSGATAGEGAQNLLCAYLAAGVLTGLILNAAFGLWWADPVIALGIAGLAVKEGRETWRGEGCCAPSSSTTSPTCDADCCAS